MKKLRAFICVLATAVFAAVAFAGCALFQQDTEFYMNTVVARVGSGTGAIEINKRQLIDAFTSYGYQYVQSGMTIGEAYDQTLDGLVDREIAAKVSEELFPLSARDREEIAENARRTSLEYMQKSLESFTKEAQEQRNWNIEPAPTPEEPETVKYTPYEKFLVSTTANSKNFVINLEKYRDRAQKSAAPKTNPEILAVLKLPQQTSGIEKSIASEAYTHLVRALASREKGLNYKYDTEAEKDAAVTRELVRIQRESEKSELINRMQEGFELGLRGGLNEISYTELKDLQRNPATFSEFERIVRTVNENYVKGMADAAIEDFRAKVKNAVWRFENKIGDTTPESYGSKLLEGLKDVYFVPRDVAKQYFTVSHILLGYSDEQKAELENIKTQYATDRNKENRDHAIAVIKKQLVVTPKDADGKDKTYTMTADEVLEYVRTQVMPDAKDKPLTQKVEDFRNMIYMFNSDPGMQNPEFEYTIGIDLRDDKSENSTEADSMSKMVPEFTRASRELYNYNYDTNVGGKKTVDGVNVDTRGTISDLVWTDYGAHIIMYTRNIADFIYTNTYGEVDANLDRFLYATLTSYGNKTYFDASFEKVTRSDYGRWQADRITDYKARDEMKIILYKHAYKDLKKSK